MTNQIIIIVAVIAVVFLLKLIFKIGKKLIIILLLIGLAFAAYTYFTGGDDNNVSKFIDEKISTIIE